MAVSTVYKGTAHDTAEGIARGMSATGERVVAASWFGEELVYRFEGMTEEEIDRWMGAEWDRLDRLRSAGVPT